MEKATEDHWGHTNSSPRFPDPQTMAAREVLCRAVSNRPGLFPPSCPGIPDQPRCAEGMRREGLAHKAGRYCSTTHSMAAMGKLRVLAIHGQSLQSKDTSGTILPESDNECISLSYKAKNTKYSARYQGCS